MRHWIGLWLVACCWMLAPGAWARGLEGYGGPDVAQAVARLTREAIWAHVAGRPYAPGRVPAALRRPAGVFVTLSRNGATRGCWGTVTPRATDAAREIASNAAKALTLDYRQRAITPRELAHLVAHVSILGDLEPVASIAALQPRRFGLWVAGAGKGGVLLPGEAATGRWQVETCRRKAGLRPRERASMYRFETAVIGPIPLAPAAH